MINPTSWKFILYPHSHVGHIDKMRQIALFLEYPCFVWNDRIYDTESGKDTGYTVGDINERT
jgi:hypothetical protein